MDYSGNQNFKELLKGFESSRVFGHVHPYDIYRQWLEAVWVMLEMWRDPEAFKAATGKLTYEHGSEMGRLFNLYVSAVEDMPFSDILGELFMRLDINSVRAGQFFTPFPIAEFMAKIQFDSDTFMSQAKEKGCVTVCDPACGSGVMLLAFAKVVHDALGREGTGKLELYGMDTDIRCVQMCRIQLRLNGLDSFGKMAGRLGLMQAGGGESCPLHPDVGVSGSLHNFYDQGPAQQLSVLRWRNKKCTIELTNRLIRRELFFLQYFQVWTFCLVSVLVALGVKCCF